MAPGVGKAESQTALRATARNLERVIARSSLRLDTGDVAISAIWAVRIRIVAACGCHIAENWAAWRNHGAVHIVVSVGIGCAHCSRDWLAGQKRILRSRHRQQLIQIALPG